MQSRFLRAYTAAFERAAIPLEVCIRRLAWLCTNGANVMLGTTAGLVGLLRVLQQEVAGHAYFVATHANCHPAHLAFKDALKEGQCGWKKKRDKAPAKDSTNLHKDPKKKSLPDRLVDQLGAFL